MLGILNPAFVRRMGAWVDVGLMLLTFTLTIGWSVEVGVAGSIVMSLLLVIHRSSKARLMILVSHQLCVLCSVWRLYLLSDLGKDSWDGQVEAD